MVMKLFLWVYDDEKFTFLVAVCHWLNYSVGDFLSFCWWLSQMKNRAFISEIGHQQLKLVINNGQNQNEIRLWSIQQSEIIKVLCLTFHRCRISGLRWWLTYLSGWQRKYLKVPEHVEVNLLYASISKSLRLCYDLNVSF